MPGTVPASWNCQRRFHLLFDLLRRLTLSRLLGSGSLAHYLALGAQAAYLCSCLCRFPHLPPPLHTISVPPVYPCWIIINNIFYSFGNYWNYFVVGLGTRRSHAIKVVGDSRWWGRGNRDSKSPQRPHPDEPTVRINKLI